MAVGGDGTINEVLNGMFDVDGPAAPDAVFAFVTSGTGGDFRKTFGIGPGTDAAIERLKHGHVRATDVGRVSCLTQSGAPTVRYFINIASFGLSGAVVDAVNRARIAKLFGGPFAFAFHSAAVMLRHRNSAVAPDRGRCRRRDRENLHRRRRQRAIFRRRDESGARRAARTTGCSTSWRWAARPRARRWPT